MESHDLVRVAMVLSLWGLCYWARYLIEELYFAMQEATEDDE